MVRSQFGARTQFSRPVRQIVTMLIIVALTAIGTWFAFPRVSGIFLSNIWLNGVIFLVFMIGVVSTFWQLIQLNRSIIWIEGFADNRPGHSATIPPRLLAPLAALLRTRGRESQISSTSASSILDSVATRLDEQRDITRYIVSLLIFLGLLGTFYGLATTVPAVVDTIRSLAPDENATGMSVFSNLMTGLEAQLGGMGTAFSSSLLGLAGSLVVGLLELFAGHGQNRFYRQLEEWLSSITRLGFAGGDVEQGAEMGAMVAVLDAIAEQMETLHRQQVQADSERAQLDQSLATLAQAIDQMNTGGGGDNARMLFVLERIADGQQQILSHYEQDSASGGPHTEAEIRLRLRNIDTQLLRILEELSAGRLESTADIRSDLSGLTHAVRQLARGGRLPRGDGS